MTQTSRLYGLYVHNLTNGKMNERDVALETVNKFLQERPPLMYEYGDVLVLMPEIDFESDNRVNNLIHEICEKNGFIVERIHPNQLYRLMDSMVIHYIFVDGMIEQTKAENYIYEWERKMGLTQADMRYTRFLKTYFI